MLPSRLLHQQAPQLCRGRQLQVTISYSALCQVLDKVSRAGFAKAAKGPAGKGAVSESSGPVEAAARAEPALKPEEYPDWVSGLVHPGKTLGELKRIEEDELSQAEVTGLRHLQSDLSCAQHTVGALRSLSSKKIGSCALGPSLQHCT